MDILIERYIEQVQDGEFYKGHVKIGEAVFNYQLVFPVPIARLDNMVLTQDSGKVRNLFQIVLSREGGSKKIELSDDEYNFFFFLLNEFVVDFYHSPQTRAYNEGILRTRGGEGVIGAFDPTVPLSTTRRSSYHLPDNIREMLKVLK